MNPVIYIFQVTPYYSVSTASRWTVTGTSSSVVPEKMFCIQNITPCSKPTGMKYRSYTARCPSQEDESKLRNSCLWRVLGNHPVLDA